jgi:hypothetical protein
MLCIGVFVLGIGVNYLGSADTVHIIYNPVVLLILWNIGVFALFLIRHFFLQKGTPNGDPSDMDNEPLRTTQSHDSQIRPHVSVKREYTFSISGWVLRKIWFSFHKYISKMKQDLKKVSSSLKITNRYMELWWDMHYYVFISRFTRLIHLLAVCLIMGALIGIYMRGLFYEYNVIWKSTFIHDLHDIAFILNIIFGLPSQLIHGAFIEASNINPLVSPHGEPAAPWIHLFAVSAFIFVIPQRFFLMFLESRRIKVLSDQMLHKEISTAVKAEVSRLSETIALYSRDRFYDDKVVPQLIQFRNNGGRIRDLEEAISQQSEGFKVELESFLETAQDDFKQSLSEHVSEMIGKKLSAIEVNVEQGIDVQANAYQKALDDTVTSQITSGISLAVTAAVAAAVGTLSGGFGKVLGIAVISTLLHTTGPIGFIIGAFAGLLLGGGVSMLAKDKITDVVKNQKFPAFSTQLILRESKMNQTVEEGRAQVYTLTKTEILNKLTPYIEEITNQIISKIALVINQQQKI